MPRNADGMSGTIEIGDDVTVLVGKLGVRKAIRGTVIAATPSDTINGRSRFNGTFTVQFADGTIGRFNTLRVHLPTDE